MRTAAAGDTTQAARKLHGPVGDGAESAQKLVVGQDWPIGDEVRDSVG